MASRPGENRRVGEALPPTTHVRTLRLALVGSLALHTLVGILLWYASGSGTWAKNSGKIVDTLVPASRIELEVCLQLDDPASVIPKKVGAKPAQLPPERTGDAESARHADDEPRAKPSSRQDEFPDAFASLRETKAVPWNFTARRGFEDSAPATPSPSPADALAGARMAGSPGPRVPVSFFRVGVQARSVVYVIDRSTSMGLRGALGTAKRELLASLSRLPGDTRFQIIIYNRNAECFRSSGRTDLIPATLENKQQAAHWLESVRPEGSTDPLPALRLALSLRPEAIFFLTDADDLNLRQVSLLTQLNSGHTAIHTIELFTHHSDGDDQPLQLLARNNHGEYHAVSVGDQ